MDNTKEPTTELNQWLLDDGKDSPNVLAFLRGYMPLIHSHQLPVDRLFIGSKMLHPQAMAWNWVYTDGEFSEKAIDRQTFERILATMPADEPLIKLEFTRPRIDFTRNKATDDDIPDGTCKALMVEQDYTEIYALPFWSRGELLIGATWATRQEGGFTDEQIDYLEKTKDYFFLTLTILIKEIVTRTLLCTYLGSDPGTRVHKGSIVRGDAVTVRSVIWFSDVRGFTSLSSRVERDIVIDLINDVFEISESVIKSCGGEILKFMGDGCLAIFTEPQTQWRRTSVAINSNYDPAALEQIADECCDDDTEGEMLSNSVRSSLQIGSKSETCAKAREAATEFQRRLKQMSDGRIQQGLPGVQVGIGLHYGDCSYGNVGAPTRLDFTVIGSAVNLASRVEGLCSKLGASVLASDDFVKRDLSVEASVGEKGIDSEELWICRGEHALKGVIGEVPVYELSMGE